VRAVVYDRFGGALTVRTVPDPVPSPSGAVIRVRATGVCRSDWHGWLGHDPEIMLPHVPGHELAGEVREVGALVRRWRPGDRVTVPFVCACGRCAQCAVGDHQVCDAQVQPGFSGWGSFAEYVAVETADVNLVALPEALDDVAGASLGCRFATAFRAVVAQGGVRPGQQVAVHGCGGVGLSAVMVAAASGAYVVAVDISPDALVLARELGATATVDATASRTWPEAVRELTGGGADVSLDALGHPLRARARCCAYESVAARPGRAAARQRRADVRADGSCHRARARDRREPRHGRARVPGDAEARRRRAVRPTASSAAGSPWRKPATR
jgi:alcohol dehydrogenase